QCFCEDSYNSRAHGVGKFIEPEMLIRSRDFAQEKFRIDHVEIVSPERADADHAKILVAHHHRIARAPFVPREQPGCDEIYVGLERAVKAVLPSFERRE